MDPDFDTLQRTQRRRFEPTTEVPERDDLNWFTCRESERPHVAETFHQATMYGTRRPAWNNSTGQFLTDLSLQLLVSRVPPERYGVETVELPEPDDLSVELDEALETRRSRRTFSGDPLSVAELATVLGLGCGRTATETKEGGIEQPRRAHPSAGGLYPVETYFLALQDGGELERGTYWYDPNAHALERQRDPDGDVDERISAAFAPGNEVFDLWETAGVLVVTATFVRSLAKYGPRGYRFALQESGHLVQNVLLLAAGLGLHAFPFGAYDDRALNDLLDLDGVDRAAIYAVPVGPAPEGGSR